MSSTRRRTPPTDTEQEEAQGELSLSEAQSDMENADNGGNQEMEANESSQEASEDIQSSDKFTAKKGIFICPIMPCAGWTLFFKTLERLVRLTLSNPVGPNVIFSQVARFESLQS